MRVELTAENFNDFVRCLMNLKEPCNDIDIKEGFIRQRSNDLTCIFEMDLTSLIGTINLPITVIKKKLDIFKLFSGHNVVFEVFEGETESDSYFTIADDQSSIKFLFPTLEFIDNKHMAQEDLQSIFSLNEEDLILHDELPVPITEKIRNITGIFNTPAIQVKFIENEASITAITQSKDQYAIFKNNIPLSIQFDGNFLLNLSTVPFSIDHDDKLEFKMYKDPTQNVSLNKISSKIGDVEVNIFSRSTIIEENAS